MNWTVLIIVVGIIIFLGLIPLALLHSQQLKQGYGPKRQVYGPTVMQGSLVCKSWKAPTLGKQLQFDYGVSLLREDEDFWGEYHYPANRRDRKPIYTGEVLLTDHQGEVKGRSDKKVVEGQLSPKQGDFLLGYPKGSLLSWLNSSFQFQIEEKAVHFLNTSKGMGTIGHTSQLEIGEDTIVGRLVDSKKFWAIEVDVRYQGVAPEITVLVILLMSNDILEFHNL